MELHIATPEQTALAYERDMKQAFPAAVGKHPGHVRGRLLPGMVPV